MLFQKPLAIFVALAVSAKAQHLVDLALGFYDSDTSVNDNDVSPYVDNIVDRLARALRPRVTCAANETVCDNGCIPLGANCCRYGNNAYCDAGEYCTNDNLCCPLGKACPGPGECKSGNVRCGAGCIPFGFVCCTSWYCNPGDSCSATGCAGVPSRPSTSSRPTLPTSSIGIPTSSRLSSQSSLGTSSRPSSSSGFGIPTSSRPASTSSSRPASTSSSRPASTSSRPTSSVPTLSRSSSVSLCSVLTVTVTVSGPQLSSRVSSSIPGAPTSVFRPTSSSTGSIRPPLSSATTSRPVVVPTNDAQSHKIQGAFALCAAVVVALNMAVL